MRVLCNELYYFSFHYYGLFCIHYGRYIFHHIIHVYFNYCTFTILGLEKKRESALLVFVRMVGVIYSFNFIPFARGCFLLFLPSLYNVAHFAFDGVFFVVVFASNCKHNWNALFWSFPSSKCYKINHKHISDIRAPFAYNRTRATVSRVCVCVCII